MKLFKTDAEKLRSRLEDLEAAAAQAEMDAEAAGREAAEAQAAAVDALVEGASVADFEKQVDAAEERSRRARRTAAAHRAAAEAVSVKLAAVEATELRTELLASLAAASVDSFTAADELRKVAPIFVAAWAKLEDSRARFGGVQHDLREAEIPSRNQDPENGFDWPELADAALTVTNATMEKTGQNLRAIGPLVLMIPA